RRHLRGCDPADAALTRSSPGSRNPAPPPTACPRGLRMRRFGSTARYALFAAALLLAACASPPKRAAGPAIDLARYMGTWYVIGHVPYFTDRGHVAARNEYTLRGDGRVGIRYFYRTGFAQPEKMLEASASVQEGSGNRDWKVWFYKVVPANYRVLE